MIIIKDTVTGKRRVEIFDELKSMVYSEPLIYLYTPIKDVISVHGNQPLDKYLNVDCLGDIEVIRFNTLVNTGAIYSSPDTIIGRVLCKDAVKCVDFEKYFIESSVEELQRIGANVKQSHHHIGSNDLVFIKDGREKKFCGMGKDGNIFYFIMTFSIDINKLKIVFKLNTEKFNARGKINDIGDVVGGLDEIVPGIDKSVLDDIIKSVTLKMKWDN